MTLPVAILAGGLGTRLQSDFPGIPKALVSVAGKPFIFHQLVRLQKEGLDKVVLCLGHLGDAVQAIVGDGRQFGISVEYSFDGPKQLGTGGALRKALPKLGEAFFVLYGDSYVQCSFANVEAVFKGSGKPALMTVFKNAGRFDRSNASFADGLVRYNKRNPTPDMQHIDYGLSVLTADVMRQYDENHVLDLCDVLAALSDQSNLAGLEIRERFYEAGSPSGLQEAEKYLSRQPNSSNC